VSGGARLTPRLTHAVPGDGHIAGHDAMQQQQASDAGPARVPPPQHGSQLDASRSADGGVGALSGGGAHGDGGSSLGRASPSHSEPRSTEGITPQTLPGERVGRGFHGDGRPKGYPAHDDGAIQAVGAAEPHWEPAAAQSGQRGSDSPPGEHGGERSNYQRHHSRGGSGLSESQGWHGSVGSSGSGDASSAYAPGSFRSSLGATDGPPSSSGGLLETNAGGEGQSATASSNFLRVSWGHASTVASTDGGSLSGQIDGARHVVHAAAASRGGAAAAAAGLHRGERVSHADVEGAAATQPRDLVTASAVYATGGVTMSATGMLADATFASLATLSSTGTHGS